MKYKKEIEFLENIKSQMQLGQITMPNRKKEFKDSEIMYDKIIKILSKIEC